MEEVWGGEEVVRVRTWQEQSVWRRPAGQHWPLLMVCAVSRGRGPHSIMNEASE